MRDVKLDTRLHDTQDNSDARPPQLIVERVVSCEHDAGLAQGVRSRLEVCARNLPQARVVPETFGLSCTLLTRHESTYLKADGRWTLAVRTADTILHATLPRATRQ